MLGSRRLALWLLAAPWALVATVQAQVLVITSANDGPAQLQVTELARVWRKQQLFVDGRRVQPLNLPAAHPLRRWFSREVLGQTPEEQQAYWRDQYFNGVLPPYVLASEEAVMRFVAAAPGALGYVSACAVDRQRVRVLLQLEGGPPCSR